MSSDYIEELIRQGENTSIEFKRGDVRTENLAKELIAFSNSSGGVVLLGIADNGEIQGLKNPRNYEEWISNLTRNNVIPPINVDYTESVLEGKKIGIIHQFFNLIPELSVLENVILPGLISKNKESLVKKEACELLDIFGILDKKDIKPSKLSGGEQQRVASARSLINKPDLILASYHGIPQKYWKGDSEVEPDLDSTTESED